MQIIVHEAFVGKELTIMGLTAIVFCCHTDFRKLKPYLSTSLIPSCHIIAALTTEVMGIIDGEFRWNKFFLMA